MKTFLVGLLAVALACGGDSTGPRASSVTGVFGDNGSVLTGGTLAIGFTVLGGDGIPLPGVRVTWAVTPANAASITPASQVSDSVGGVATVVRVGSTVGAFTVNGSVNGVDPIAFHLSALDPCEYEAPYALGDTVVAALATTDCRRFLGGAPFFYDYYRLDLPAGQHNIRINTASSGPGKIDPYVDLFSLTGEQIAWDDDIQPGVIQTSQLDIILGSGGAYLIGATSFDADTTGPYTLSSITRTASLTGCQDAWMTPGATIIDTIRSTDCADSSSNFADIVFLYMQPSEVIKVAQRSSAVNPLLTLYHANFQLQRFDSVAANDDSASGNQNAYISYTVPAYTGPLDGWYLLLIGTATPAETGEYTLAFSAATSAATASRGADRKRVLRALPSGTFRRWKKPK